MKLWDFQQEAVDACRERFSKKEKKLILCSPTGSGKTVLGCHLADTSLKKGKTVCILVDRKEILKQFAKALAQFNLYPELIVAGSTKLRRTNLYLGMVESFNRRFGQKSELDGIDFFLLDEAHSTSYFKILRKARSSSYALGLTATPVLTNSKERLNDYYDGIVELAKVEQLIKIGKLCDSKTYSLDLLSERRLRMAGGDFSVDSQLDTMGGLDVMGGVVKHFKTICPNSRFICYNINVEHSQKMARMFNFAGIKCRHVDGNTDPVTRDEIFRQLNDGTIQGVHNFGICTTGFDEPAVDCIIQNFATFSLSKHIQTAGRGARIYPGKEHFTILDMGRNFSRHGLWNRNKDWTDIFNNPSTAEERDRQESEAVGNINCPTCGYVVQSDMEYCPVCATAVADMVQRKLREAKEGKLTPKELKLIKEQASETLPPELKGKKPGDMNYGQLLAYAKHMGYNTKWVYIQMGKRKKRYIEDRFSSNHEY